MPPPPAATPVEKTWQHETDPSLRRATFGVRYPVFQLELNKSEDEKTKIPQPRTTENKRRVEDVRVHLNVTSASLSAVWFLNCMFHRPDNAGISAVSFKDCLFERCMLGGTTFHHVRFNNCTFDRSDFGGSTFTDCRFVNCIFKNCTGEHATFTGTEINPRSIMAGLQFPSYNHPATDRVRVAKIKLRVARDPPRHGCVSSPLKPRNIPHGKFGPKPCRTKTRRGLP